MNSSTLTLQPVLAASSDARELWSIVVLLVVLGIGLVMLAVAVYRVTRPDHELLAPLEVMGRRKWRNSDPVWQRRELDAVRPPAAEPLAPARFTPVPLEGFDEGPKAPGFDDLHGDHELGPEELLDVGVEAGLVGLPGDEVFDPDPTPPSTEVPVIVAEARGDLSLAQRSIDWSPPSHEDLAAATEAPRFVVADDAITDTAVDEASATAAADDTSGTASEDEDIDPEMAGDSATDGVDNGSTESVVDDHVTDAGDDDETTPIVVEDEVGDAVVDDVKFTETVDDDDTSGAVVEDEAIDTVVDDKTTDTVR